MPRFYLPGKACKGVGACKFLKPKFLVFRRGGGTARNLARRVKLVAETGDGQGAEFELARIKTEDWAVPETLGLSLREGKKITAAIQSEMIRIQAAKRGDRFRFCQRCGSIPFIAHRAIRRASHRRETRARSTNDV